MFGAGGGTSSYREAEETDLIVLWGSNARESHPIFFHHLLRGVRNGARLYAVDPRRTSSAEWADVWLGLDVGSDIALAVTGVAGPDGGTSEKPVGTVFIALAAASSCQAKSYRFNGNRAEIRAITSFMAMNWLRRYLLTHDPHNDIT